MELESTSSRGFTGTLQVQITADRFPAITGYCARDPEFQRMIASNLERVVEEYLNAAETQVAAAQPESE